MSSSDVRPEGPDPSLQLGSRCSFEGEERGCIGSVCEVGNNPFLPRSSPIHQPSITSFNKTISSPTRNDSSSADPEKSLTARTIFGEPEEGLARAFKVLKAVEGELEGVFFLLLGCDLEDLDECLRRSAGRVVEFSASPSTSPSPSSRVAKFSLSFFPRPFITESSAEDAHPVTLNRAEDLSLSFSFSLVPTVAVLSALCLDVLEEGRDGPFSPSDLRLAFEDFLLVNFCGGATSSSEDSTTCDRVDRWDFIDPCLALGVECADVNGRGGGLEAATRSKVTLC